MVDAKPNSVVRLKNAVPTLWLGRGDVGVVRSVWRAPANCFEVEFARPGECPVRALLNAELLEVVEGATPGTGGRH